MRFPTVEGENLAGVRCAFPRDFARLTIAIVAFDLKQRADLESWVPFVEGYARGGTADGRVFPVLPRSMRMMKGMILTTMRKAAPSVESRAVTVPLFVDIDEFCSALQIVDRAAIQVYVVTPEGSVLMRTSGPYVATAAAEIAAALPAGA